MYVWDKAKIKILDYNEELNHNLTKRTDIVELYQYMDKNKKSTIHAIPMGHILCTKDSYYLVTLENPIGDYIRATELYLIYRGHKINEFFRAGLEYEQGEIYLDEERSILKYPWIVETTRNDDMSLAFAFATSREAFEWFSDLKKTLDEEPNFFNDFYHFREFYKDIAMYKN